MKLFLHTLAVILFVLPTYAAESAFDVAQNIAKRYCQEPSLKKTGVKPSSSLRSASDETPSYFIFADDTKNNFCIVSGDGETVLGYGDNYSDEMPSVLQEALDMYAATPQRRSQLRSSVVRENIPAFLGVIFGTRLPYNMYIPDREGYGPPVGCVPVTLAQICKYYNHPAKLMNDIPSYSHLSSAYPDSIFFIEGQKAEGRTYKWDLIQNNYPNDSTYSDEQNKEVAKLMWDCARSVETKFEQSGSAALSTMLHYSLIHYFGYNSDSIKTVSRNLYYREEWLDIIHEELSKKRPIYMTGTSYHHGGHAFICDGYVDGYLHINWGWNGSCDGYFDVDILDYGRSKYFEQVTPDNGYSFYESIIIGIEPGEGISEYPLPQPSNTTIREKKEYVTVNTRYRATDNGFIMYASLESYKKGMTDSLNFAIGYVNENEEISFMTNEESDHFKSEILKTSGEKEFDNSFLGKEIKLFILESDSSETEILTKDSIYDWWYVSSLFEPITITIPDTIVNHNNIINPKQINMVGDYADTTIILNIEFQSEKPEESMKYLSLALIMDDDTLMSETKFDTKEYNKEKISLKASLKDPDLEKEMRLIVMQTDYVNSTSLNNKEWGVCNNFEPIDFKLSDITIFSKKFVVDTIMHTTNGIKQRFEITLSNPTPFEFYNDVYFLLDNEDTGLMIDIPAGGTTTTIIEKDIPLLTRYINGVFSIHNYFETAKEQIYVKDTFSHVFYGLGEGDETTIVLQLLNMTNNSYDNTFYLLNGSDTIGYKPATLKPESGAQVDFSLPVIVSDTDFIKLDLNILSIYDKDNNRLARAYPLDYYGKISQSFDDGDKIISFKLNPVDTIIAPLVIGFTNSLDNLWKYQRLQYNPQPGTKDISIDFNLSKYSTIEKPKYFGLCKEDGTFYAYMELTWDNINSVSNITSNELSIIVVDGGICISSDEEIPSLAIYNIEGKIVKTVGLKAASTIFVPLAKGVYVIRGKKFIIHNA